MGCKCKLTAVLILIGAAYVYIKLKRAPLEVPVIEEKWWAAGPPREEDPTIRPFKINVSKEVIADLKRRLDTALPLQPPLEGVNQNYGINGELLGKIVDHWKTKYDWNKRQEFLNQFPQFQTNIQGLNIHFIHAKPKNVPQGVEVLPLILIHGWPGSVREFYEIIPILTTPQKGRNFVFEVIAPSLPGYGFSDAAVRPGLNQAQIAQIFNKLMKRLKFDRFYAQGGDWGSAISHDMAILYPENVIALHRNFCFAYEIANWKAYVGMYFPSLFFTEKEAAKIYPLSDTFNFIMLEFGYFHIQATKPDTVGVALRESPVGLAAYIIEKFITWTNPQWKDLPDGGLTQKYTYDKLLDNVMIYWVTRSITTSVRLYAEANSKSYRDLPFDKLPINVPAGCIRFSNELIYSSEILLREQHPNLIQLSDGEGGHFAALEVPEVLAQDIIEFVGKVRTLPPKTNSKEL